MVQISSAMLSALPLLRNRTGLAEERTIRLGTFGYLDNAVTVLWGLENLVVSSAILSSGDRRQHE
jgi:hypothetical protein